MSEKINTLFEIKNELNTVINLRKKTISTIEKHQNTISGLLTKLETLKKSMPLEVDQIKIIEHQIEQLDVLINTLKINNENHVYNIDNLLTSEQSEKFQLITEIFNAESKIYTKNKAIDYLVSVSQIELEYIVCNHKALKFVTHDKKTIIIYPTIILLEDEENSFYIVQTSELVLTYKKNEILQNNEHKIDSKDNHTATFFIATMLDELFYFENEQLLSSFESKFNDYKKSLVTLNSPSIKGIKKEYYSIINEFGNKYFEFLQQLSTHQLFINYLKDKQKDTSIKYIKTMGIVDLIKCFSAVTDIKDTSSNEAFAIMFLQNKLNGLPIEKYEDLIKLNDKESIKYYIELTESLSSELKDVENTLNFNLATLLYPFDNELYTEYLSNIYQFASLIIKADGKVTRNEEDFLKKIMTQTSDKLNLNLPLQHFENNKEKNLDELLFDLYDLTGLQIVKQEINTLINLIKVKKAREEFDLKNTDMSLHIVFSGNPGTGKTTVARHLAKIYKCLGVLSKGHLVETDRSGLIAEFVGQTAVKVNKLVDSALNGVLFIDEAYAIFSDDKDTYGKEAIATLLKRMEDDRDKLIVVLAGYTDQMKTFINSNPGLKSRFNKYISFTDYTPIELYSIFIGMSRKLNFVLEDSLPDLLKLRFSEEIEKGDSAFGNGRYVRNLFEKMLEKQANRLALDTELSKEKLSTLKIEDLPNNI